MFTGIIEEVGRIKSFDFSLGGASIEVECNNVIQGTKIGDSIAINGVCETVTELLPNSFKAKISKETLAVTNFSDLKKGEFVNLERALTLNSRLGGHLVSGHIDCIGQLVDILKNSEFYDLTFEIPQELEKYVVYKGSIAINGISLTVARIEASKVRVAIIPHTFNNTSLKNLEIGSKVNIETDILGKYVEKMLFARDNKENHISMEFLVENGFV